MHIQWVSRFLTCWGGVANHLAPSLQVVAVLGLTECSETPLQMPLPAAQSNPRIPTVKSGAGGSGAVSGVSPFQLQRFAASVGLHKQLCTQAPVSPLISKCALLRACLSAYEDSALVYVPYCYAVQGVERHVMAVRILRRFPLTTISSSGTKMEKLSLIVTYVFSAIMQMCAHSSPSCRLYGLQTLETWFSRLEMLEPTPTDRKTFSLVSPVLNKAFGTPVNGRSSISSSVGGLEIPAPAVSEVELRNVIAMEAEPCTPLDSWFIRLEQAEFDNGAGLSDHAYPTLEQPLDQPDGSMSYLPEPLPLPASALLPEMRAVSQMLAAAWNHPSKQV